MNPTTNVGLMPQPYGNPGMSTVQPVLGSNGGGSALGGFGTAIGDIGSLYGAYTGAQTMNNFNDAANAGYGMARGAYNLSPFGLNGVGGSGFSVNSPTGGPGSLSTNLGALDPMYGAYAGSAGNYNNIAGGLASNASGGATGAYNTALSSMLPQLSNMQNDAMAANNNALFQRGQIGSGSFGQYGSNGNPTNLTTSSMAQGFGLADLQAIMAAQNQGLNFMNSNISGANTIGNLGYGATGAAGNMIGYGNAQGQLPLAYAQLNAGQQIGATNAMGQVLRGSQMPAGSSLPASGWGSIGSSIGSSLLGGNNGIGQLVQQLFGGNNGGGNLFTAANGMTGPNGSLLSSGNISSAYNAAGQGLAGYTPDALSTLGASDLSSVGDMSSYLGDIGFNTAGGEAAAGAASSAAPGVAADASTAFAPSSGIGAYATGGAPFSSAAGAGADAGAAAGSDAGAMSAAIPAAAGLAGMGAFMAIMGNQPGTHLSGNYWNNLNQTLAAGPGTDQMYGADKSINAGAIKQYTGYEGALSDLANDVAGQGGKASGNNVIPNSEWQQLAQYGITPQSVAGYSGSYAQAAADMPSIEAENAEYGIPDYSKSSNQGK